MTPGLLNSQEDKNYFNSKMLNCFYQLLNMFRKFKKITIQCIAATLLRTTDPGILSFDRIFHRDRNPRAMNVSVRFLFVNCSEIIWVTSSLNMPYKSHKTLTKSCFCRNVSIAASGNVEAYFYTTARFTLTEALCYGSMEC